MKKYENLTNKLLKVRKVRDVIFKYRYAIIGATVLTIATTSTLCGITGVVTDKGKVAKSYEYGDKIDIVPNAIFSDCYIEYAKAGTDDWSKVVPEKVGTYDTRVISKNVSKKEKISKYATFEIVPKKILLDVDTSKKTYKYGDLPEIINEELAYGDELTAGKVVLEDYTKEKTKAYVDSNSVHIMNRSKQDVTNCYTFESLKEDINVTKRDISIKLVGGDKVYDGKEFDNTQTEVTYGSLAYFDKIKTYDKSSIVTPDDKISGLDRDKTIKIFNKDNIDVTDFYNVSSYAEDINIKKAPLKIKSVSLEREYNGKLPTKEETQKFEYVEGILPEHKLVYNFPEVLDNKYIFPTQEGEGYANEFSFDIVLKDDENVSVKKYYDIPTDLEMWGTIQTKPKELFVETESKNDITYDGETHSITTLKSVDGLIEGDSINVTKATEVKEATNPVDNDILAYEITNEEFGNVTNAYKLNITKGKLGVLKKNINISLKSLTDAPTTKYYDGNELNLKDENLDYSQESLAIGDYLVLDEEFTEDGLIEPTFNEKGENVSKTIKYKAKVVNKDNTKDLSSNYNFNYLNNENENYGNAEIFIKKRNLNIGLNNGNDIEMSYDGSDLKSKLLASKPIVHDAEGTSNLGSGLANNEQVDIKIKDDVEVRNAGEYDLVKDDLIDYKVSKLASEGSEAKDTTNFYNVTFDEKGSKAIAHKQTLTFEKTFEKTYDDKPFNLQVSDNNSLKDGPKLKLINVESYGQKEKVADRIKDFNDNFNISYHATSNGMNASNNNYEVTMNDFQITQKAKIEGQENINFDIKIQDGQNIQPIEISQLSNQFDLKINKRDLDFKFDDYKGLYKEEWKNFQVSDSTKGHLIKGHTITKAPAIFTIDEAAHPGEYVGGVLLDIDNLVITRNADSDLHKENLAKNYNIIQDEKNPSKISIIKDNITIKTQSYKKTYDGYLIPGSCVQKLEIEPKLRTGHSLDYNKLFTYKANDAGVLLNNDEFDVNKNSNATLDGPIVNSLCKSNVTGDDGKIHETYGISNGKSLLWDSEYYYNIELIEGEFEILPRKVTVKGISTTANYEGRTINVHYAAGEITGRTKGLQVVNYDLFPSNFKISLNQDWDFKRTNFGQYDIFDNSGEYLINHLEIEHDPRAHLKPGNQEAVDYVDETAINKNFIIKVQSPTLTINKATLKVKYIDSITTSIETFNEEEFVPRIATVYGLQYGDSIDTSAVVPEWKYDTPEFDRETTTSATVTIDLGQFVIKHKTNSYPTEIIDIVTGNYTIINADTFENKIEIKINFSRED